MKARTARAASAPRRNVLIWWGGLGCGAVVVVLPGTAVLLLTLLAPVALMTMLPEEGPGRRIVGAGLLFGLAASVHPLLRFWQGDGSVAAALSLVRQPTSLFTAWTAILVSWLVGEMAGIVVRVATDVSAISQRRTLTTAIAELEQEWGPLEPPSRPA